jgi:chromodomain-helicase-DNA-binding protein 1
MLQYLYERERSRGPFIVIAPLSLCVNWQEEAKKYTPQLQTALYIGNMQQREALRTDIIQYILDEKNNTKFERKHNPNLPFQILITTYEIVMRVAAFLATFNWVYLIGDEAHRLKNPSSSLVTSLKQFRVRTKLLLTGTPLQNNIRGKQPAPIAPSQS